MHDKPWHPLLPQVYVDQVLAVMTRGCIKFGSRGRRNLESEVVLYNDNDNVNVSWVKFN